MTDSKNKFFVNLLTRFFLVLLVESSLLTFVYASGGAGHEKAGIESLFWPTCNFVLYVILMTYLYRKFARPVLRDQRIELEAFVVRAQNEKATLDSEISQLKERLSLVEEEKTEIVTRLEKEGRLMADNLISMANEKSRRMKQDLAKWHAGEIQRNKVDARNELVSRIVSKVRDDLKMKFSSSEDKQFIKSSLVSLPQINNK